LTNNIGVKDQTMSKCTYKMQVVGRSVTEQVATRSSDGVQSVADILHGVMTAEQLNITDVTLSIKIF